MITVLGNCCIGHTIKLNIMNLQKDDSSYYTGMKPFVYSYQKNRETGTNQWQRGCQNVSYYKNQVKTKHWECAVTLVNYVNLYIARLRIWRREHTMLCVWWWGIADFLVEYIELHLYLWVWQWHSVLLLLSALHSHRFEGLHIHATQKTTCWFPQECVQSIEVMWHHW